MTKKNILFLLPDNYPASSGEFFLDDEMRIIANRFEQIIVVTKEQEGSASKHFVPENMKICTYPEETFSDKLKAIPFLFYSFFINEFLFAINKYKINQYFMLFKIMYMDIVRALKLKAALKRIKIQYVIPDSNTIYYSYWHDYRALALSLIKRENPKSFCISRAHNWDVFFGRHTPPYLPFKKYIINSLTQTFSVSNAGKTEFQRIIGSDIDNKVSVSKLGKINARVYCKEKQSQNFLFCSCSYLVPVKRVHLIIDILSNIKLENIQWVHFGDGPLRKEIEEYAKKQIPHINFIFKSMVNNAEILDFYNQNYVELFINVSASEGIPVSIMEALSAGIPVLATNVGGTSEAVNEETGFLIEKDFSAEKVAAIIENYLLSPDEKIKEYRKRAYHFWQENYNAEKNFTNFADRILQLKKGSYQECTKCLYTTYDYPEIIFDENGVCTVCHTYYDLQNKTVFKNQEGNQKLKKIIYDIKKSSKKREYDCILGVSGGVDSSYLTYLAKEWCLRPLVVHIDNGWNSELSVTNIKNILKRLNFDLYTYVINWEEMKDIQLAFLKSSVLDIDLPFDNAFVAALYKIARKHRTKFILAGYNTVTEGWMPDNFTHYKLDSINLKHIHKRYGKIPLSTFPIIGPIKLWMYENIYNIRMVCPLNYISYNKNVAKKILINKFGWRDHGGKHYENFYTKFYQGYILPEKYKIDKRKSHLSTLICSGQITKEVAIEEIKKNPYNPNELMQDKEFFIKKLGINTEDFDKIMNLPPKKHTDFPSYINIFNFLRKIKKVLWSNNK